jgi:hypothetical protein
VTRYGWILAGLLLIVCIWLFYTNRELRIVKEAYNQNALALGDTLKKIEGEKADLYSKYVSILDANKFMTDELAKENTKILALTQENLQLRDIIAHGAGTVVIDTGGVKHYSFANNTDFYSYTINVDAVTPPQHYLNLKFRPLSLTNFITRDKQGVWNSYIRIEAPLNKYLSVSDIKTILDKDEWVGLPPQDKFTLSLIPLGTIIIDAGDTHLSVGALASISNKWVLGYSTTIGLDLKMIHVGYSFNIIK